MLSALVASLSLSPLAQAQWLPTNYTTGPIYFTGGNVGIGPTAPANKLDIGSGAFTALPGIAAAVSNTSGNSVLSLGQSMTARGRLVWVYNASEASGYMALGNPGGQPLVLQDGSGNVGIGTTSPQQLLHVGTGAIEVNGASTSTTYASRVPSVIFSRADIPTSWLNRITNSWSGNTYDATMNFEVTSGASTYATPLTLTGGGRVGIGGVSNPQFPLSVHGYIQSYVTPDSATSTPTGLILSNSPPTGTATYDWHIITGSPNQSSGAFANGLEMWEFPPANSYGACCLQRFVLKKASTTTMPAQFLIDGLGNVGIGVANPAYALDVNGTIHATQVIGATYQDVAEWVPATTKMSPGTVVVVQRGSKNTVAPSAAAYATAVAGVVSEKPGLILGESSDAKAMIATTGRVKVHVDAGTGAIEAGDLLVTSDKPGVAMKSQPVDLGSVKIHRPGTLIGKALEALPSGEGDILVLLSLQ